MPETVKRKRTAPPPAVTTHQEIRAQSFVLVDGTGRRRAALTVINDGLGNDDALLMMYDAQGRFRLSLRAGAHEATINIFGDPKRKDDGHTVDLLRAGWDRHDQTPVITMWDRETGNGQIVVRYDEDQDSGDGDKSDAAS